LSISAAAGFILCVIWVGMAYVGWQIYYDYLAECKRFQWSIPLAGNVPIENPIKRISTPYENFDLIKWMALSVPVVFAAIYIFIFWPAWPCIRLLFTQPT
jgi:hypothetical protein